MQQTCGTIGTFPLGCVSLKQSVKACEFKMSVMVLLILPACAALELESVSQWLCQLLGSAAQIFLDLLISSWYLHVHSQQHHMMQMMLTVQIGLACVMLLIPLYYRCFRNQVFCGSVN
mmetsp:Transcript_38112/g.62304  ORF Transcript_38112/g.62304 Transcript_38112/m.62304 type:complete len:118 (+) Transcript_38112:1250-1603(+)